VPAHGDHELQQEEASVSTNSPSAA
jgi:hypothetical protein